MSKTTDLAKNTIILFIGNVCTKIAQFILLPIYTGILSTEEYGSVELANTIISFSIPLITLQIEKSTFRFLIDARKNKEEKDKIISTSVAFLLSTLAISGTLIFVIGANLQYDLKYPVMACIFANCLYLYEMQIARGLGKTGLYAINSLLATIFTMLCNIFLLFGLHMRSEAFLYGSAIAYVIGVIVLLFKMRIYSYISWKKIDPKILKKMLKYSIPIIFSSFSWWIFSSSDRVIVSSILGLSVTGILSISYKFSNILIALYEIFDMSLTESLSVNVNEEDFNDYYNLTFSAFSNIFISIGTVLIAFMPILFKILIDPKFSQAYYLIPISILASIFQILAVICTAVYIAKRETKLVAITSIMSAITNIVTHLLLINIIGVYAAVISTLVSYVALFIQRFYDINKKYVRVKSIFKVLFNLSLSTSVVFVLYYIDTPISFALSIVFAVGFALYFNRDSIFFIFNLVKNKVGKK